MVDHRTNEAKDGGMKRAVKELAMQVPLTPAENRILKLYADLADTDGRFRRSRFTIGKDASCSEKTVRRANRKFRDMKILSWIAGHGNGDGQMCVPNQYLLNFVSASESTKRE
jgi:hypothetical protein